MPSPSSRWNYHPEYEVHLITAGTGWFVVGDCIDIFAAGQLVLVGSNVPHHWISDLAPGERLPERDVVFQFHPDWVDACTAVPPELTRTAPLRQRARRGIEFAGGSLAAAADHLIAIGDTEGASRVEHIFGLLGAMADADEADQRLLSDQWSAGPANRYPPSGGADWIDLAYAYVLEHLADPDLRMGGAAQHVGLSVSAFSRYFSQVSGRSFTDTVRRIRLAQAGKLRHATDLPVAGIAHRVGYANLSNFNRQFRAHHGHTPREHRSTDRASTTARAVSSGAARKYQDGASPSCVVTSRISGHARQTTRRNRHDGGGTTGIGPSTPLGGTGKSRRGALNGSRVGAVS